MISKIYNPATQKWEKMMSDNSDHIAVTDQRLLDTSANTDTLTNVLLSMQKDIDRTKRNLSWVVKNGTLGGNNGPGPNGPAAAQAVLEITGMVGSTTPIKDDTEGNHTLYTAVLTDLQLSYFITEDETNSYTLKVFLDGHTDLPVKMVTTTSRSTKSITIDNLEHYGPSDTFHVLRFELIDSEDNTVSTYTLRVQDVGLVLECSNKSPMVVIAGTQNKLTFVSQSKLLNTDILLYIWDGKFTSQTDGARKIVDLGKFTSIYTKMRTTIDVSEIGSVDLINDPRTTYNIFAQLQAESGAMSDVIAIQLMKSSSEELVIAVSGLYEQFADEEGNVSPVTPDVLSDYTFETVTTLGFNLYTLQTNVSSINYAAIMHRYGTTSYTDLVGSWSTSKDANFNNETEKLQAFKSASISGATKTNIGITYPLEGFDAGNDGTIYQIDIFCLAEGKSIIYEKNYFIFLKKSSNSLFAISGGTRGMQYAHWNITQSTFNALSTSKASGNVNWTSTCYMAAADGSNASQQIDKNLVCYGINGVDCGFLNDTNFNEKNSHYNLDNSALQPKLRFSNETYGVIEVPMWLNADNWGKSDLYGGFTISLTFKTDDMPYSTGTIFQAGYFSEKSATYPEGTFYGVRVTLTEVEIVLADDIKLSAAITNGITNTIDIVYDKAYQDGSNADETSSIIKVFVNGIIVAAQDLTKASGDKMEVSISDSGYIYLGCRYNKNLNNATKRDQFVDVNFYDINLYHEPLTDKEIVINYLVNKAQTHRNSAGMFDWDTYNEDLKKNFIPSTESTASKLWNNTTNYYQLESSPGSAINWNDLLSMSTELPMPVVYLDCTDAEAGTLGSFTESYYHTIQPDVETFRGVKFYMYDPATNHQLMDGETPYVGECTVKIQGTSTKGYRSKNLEVGFGVDAATDQPRLMQVKSTWFPENSYTLKCDMVDSAHANNAAIGRWINEVAYNAGLLEQTPPMQVVAANPPSDTYNPSYRWQQERDANNNITKQGPGVKFTLEGFQVLLLVKFAPEDAASTPTQKFLGIYSFNLGRGSYYNMGFKFFKNYSFRNNAQDNRPITYPSMVTTYESYRKDEMVTSSRGNILPNQIFSWEINNNYIIDDKRLFAQADPTMLRMWGDWKYDGTIEDSNDGDNATAANSLLGMVTDVANIIWDNSEVRPQYQAVYNSASGTWSTSPKNSSLTGANVSYQVLLEDLDQRLSFKNTFGYFIIVQLMGLVDSLGKNCVFRCWDVHTEVDANGQTQYLGKWYPSFYDLDTALSVSNTGNQDVAPTAYVNYYEGMLDEYGVQRSINIIPGSIEGQYDQPNGWIWQMWEATESLYFMKDIYSVNIYDSAYKNYYSYYWNILRSSVLNSAEDFMSYFEDQVGNSGELLYNADYNVKYLTKYNAQADVNPDAIKTFANVKMLHGKRVDYVRQWMTQHINFLDSVYELLSISKNDTYNISGAFSTYGASSGNSNVSDAIFNTQTGIQMILNVSKPGIYRFLQGSSSGDTMATQNFFLKANEDTKIAIQYFANSNNTQLAIYGYDAIQKFEGFQSFVFQQMMTLSLPCITDLDLSYQKYLYPQDAITLGRFVDSKNNINLRHIDISGCQFDPNASATTKTLNLDLAQCNKLLTLNAANSCVTALTLPPSGVLQSFDIKYCSALTTVTITDQSYISNIDFTGCASLQNIVIRNVSNIKTLDFSNLPNIKNIEISGCENLTKITCKNHRTLANFTVSNCPNVTEIDFSNTIEYCVSTEPGEVINLTGATQLKRLNCQYCFWDQADLILYYVNEQENCLKDMTYLNLSHSYIHSIHLSKDSVNPEPDVLDLTPFTNILNKTNFRMVSSSTNVSTYINITYNTSILNLRLPNNKEAGPYLMRPNNATSYTSVPSLISGCSSLRHIYGYIGIGSGTFYNLQYFKLNDNYSDLIESKYNNLINESTNKDYQDVLLNNGKDLFFDNSSTTSKNTCTNIQIYNTNLGYTFVHNYKLNIDDFYYVMGKTNPACNGNSSSTYITSLYETFYYCNGLSTDISHPLKRNTFKYCTQVTSTSYLFYATYVAGPIYSPTTNTSYDGTLSPLVNCTNMSYMFSSYGYKYYDNRLFGPASASQANWKVTNLNGIFFINSSSYEYVVDDTNVYTGSNTTVTPGVLLGSTFMKYLPNLTSLQYFMSGSNVTVYFDTKYCDYSNINNIVIKDNKPTDHTNYYEFTPILINKDQVTSLFSFCNGIKAMGKLIRLFGGDGNGYINSKQSELKLPTTSLTKINQSFVISSFVSDQSTNGRTLLTNSNLSNLAINSSTQTHIYYYIDNYMFRYTTKMAYIGYNDATLHNNTKDFSYITVTHNSTDVAPASTGNSISNRLSIGSYSFNGNASIKYFIPDIVDTEEYAKFPYKIFSFGNDWVAVPFFFAHMQYGGNSNIPEIEISLPNRHNDDYRTSMFYNCNNLQIITGLFYRLGQGPQYTSDQFRWKYTLSSKGFINCALTSVDFAFFELNEIHTQSIANTPKSCKQGMVPYGLFYMEKTNTGSTYSGYTVDSTAITNGILTNLDEFIWDNQCISNTQPICLVNGRNVINDASVYEYNGNRYLYDGTEYYVQGYEGMSNEAYELNNIQYDIYTSGTASYNVLTARNFEKLINVILTEPVDPETKKPTAPTEPPAVLRPSVTLSIPSGPTFQKQNNAVQCSNPTTVANPGDLPAPTRPTEVAQPSTTLYAPIYVEPADEPGPFLQFLRSEPQPPTPVEDPGEAPRPGNGNQYGDNSDSNDFKQWQEDKAAYNQYLQDYADWETDHNDWLDEKDVYDAAFAEHQRKVSAYNAYQQYLTDMQAYEANAAAWTAYNNYLTNLSTYNKRVEIRNAQLDMSAAYDTFAAACSTYDNTYTATTFSNWSNASDSAYGTLHSNYNTEYNAYVTTATAYNTFVSKYNTYVNLRGQDTAYTNYRVEWDTYLNDIAKYLNYNVYTTANSCYTDVLAAYNDKLAKYNENSAAWTAYNQYVNVDKPNYDAAYATYLNNMQIYDQYKNDEYPALMATYNAAYNDYQQRAQNYTNMFTKSGVFDTKGWFLLRTSTYAQTSYNMQNLGYTIDGKKYIHNGQSIASPKTITTNSYKTYKNTINRMHYVLGGFYDMQATPYKMANSSYDLRQLKYISKHPNFVEHNEGESIDDLWVMNPNYNPMKYYKNSNKNTTLMSLKLVNTGSAASPSYKLVASINDAYDPREVTINKTFNPYQYIFNKYRHDGNYENLENIKFSTIYAKILMASHYNSDGELTSVDEMLYTDLFGGAVAGTKYTVSPDIYVDENDKYMYRAGATTDNDTDAVVNAAFADVQNRLKTPYYMVPPDLFRYSATNTTIFGSLSAASKECKMSTGTVDNSWQYRMSGAYGIYGRICPFLFETLTATANFGGVFGNTNISPYTWPQTATGVADEDGVVRDTGMFLAPNTFANNTSMNRISYLFYNQWFWKNVKISQFFERNTGIAYANNAFQNCYWLQEPDSGLFTTCGSLQEIQYIFANSSYWGTYANSLKVVPACILPTSRHKNLSNVAYAFYYQGGMVGEVPQLWLVSTLAVASRHTYAFRTASTSISNNITNRTSIPQNQEWY